MSGLTDAVELTTGYRHTCARRSSGVAVCWGSNEYGQLGDGTITDRLTPTPVSGLTDAVELSAGHRHTCARQSSGLVACWGSNAYGQLGNGTTFDQRVPAAVTGLTGALELSAGWVHTCARPGGSDSGGVVCWGSNFTGEIGDGTTSDRRVPTPVLGL